MDYLGGILEGHFNKDTRHNLADYIFREYLNAKRANIGRAEFFDGCLDIIDVFLNHLIDSVSEKKSQLDTFLASGGTEEQLAQWNQDFSALNPAVDLGSLTNRNYTHDMHYSDVLAIERAIYDADLMAKIDSLRAQAKTKTPPEEPNPASAKFWYLETAILLLNRTDGQTSLFIAPNGQGECKTIKTPDFIQWIGTALSLGAGELVLSQERAIIEGVKNGILNGFKEEMQYCRAVLRDGLLELYNSRLEELVNTCTQILSDYQSLFDYYSQLLDKVEHKLMGIEGFKRRKQAMKKLITNRRKTEVLYGSVQLIEGLTRIIRKLSDIQADGNRPSQPQPINSILNTQKYTAKHYVLAYLFDCNATGKSLQSGNKKELERIGNRLMGVGKGNRFYKVFNEIASKDLNSKNVLIENGGENWREAVLELSEHPTKVEQYLIIKQL